MLRYLYVAACVVACCAAPAAWAKNVAPVVTLTAPANGTSFTVPATIVLSANASDADGSVTTVAFYNGTTLIGTSTTAPHTVTWPGVAAGTYALSAKATDNLGATGVSAVANVTVSAPKIAVTSPLNGSAVYGATVNVSGSFVGDATTTVLIDNGNSTRLAALNGNAFQATLPVFIGPNTLSIQVTRRDGTSDKASVGFTGNETPSIAWQSPTATVFDAPATLTLAVDAVSPSGSISQVAFQKNGIAIATVSAPPYQTVLSNLGVGNYSLTATATDNNGQAVSAWRSVRVNGANVTPTASMTSPASGTVLTAPATIALRASASDPDGTIGVLEFLQNGFVVSSTNITPYAATLSNVAAGSYLFAARATDNRGASATSASVSVTVMAPNAAPSVALTSPAAGGTYIAPATLNLAAAASDADGSVTKVDFFSGTTLIGTASAPNFVFNWTGVGAGSYQLTARATDNAGAVGTSPPVQVNVALNAAPNVSISSSWTGAQVFAPASIDLAAAAGDSDGSIVKVDFYDGATLIGTATDAPYKVSWTNVTAGSHTVTAVAFDNLGASTVSAPLTVTISAPSIVFGAPSNGAEVRGDMVLVSGTVVAPLNAGVSINGVVAMMSDDSHFYARVPVGPGANAIVATLTTPSGQTATQSITVNGDGVPSPLQVTVSAAEGAAPLAASFKLVNGGSSTSTVTLESGAPMTLEPGAEGSFDVTLSGAGAQVLSISASDAQGVTVQQFAVVANDPAAVNQKFAALWSGMNNAVITGDKATALSYLSEPARAKYGPVFDILQGEYAQIAASFSSLRAMMASADMAEYAVNRTVDGDNRIFLIYFLRDLDGVWRLDSM